MQGKLDGYRSEVNKGKNLNEDQQLAVSKYDEVSFFLNPMRKMVSNNICMENK